MPFTRHSHSSGNRQEMHLRLRGLHHHILDMPEAESDELLKMLFDEVQKPDNIYRHKWRLGDLMMWDNCAVQHKVSLTTTPALRRRMNAAL